jgi:hypothetical protein
MIPVSTKSMKYRAFAQILPMLKTGAKIQAFIPPELSYGSRPPPNVPPNAVRVFDVDFIAIPPPPSPVPAPHPSANSTTPVVSGQIIRVPSAEEMKNGAQPEVITNVPNSK